MNQRAIASLWVWLLVIAFAGVACGADDSDPPDISPAYLKLEATVGTAYNAEITILNPMDVARQYRLSTSSPHLTVHDEFIAVPGHQSQEATVVVECPPEPGDYLERLEITAVDSPVFHVIDIDLTCLPLRSGQRSRDRWVPACGTSETILMTNSFV